MLHMHIAASTRFAIRIHIQWSSGEDGTTKLTINDATSTIGDALGRRESEAVLSFSVCTGVMDMVQLSREVGFPNLDRRRHR